MNPIVRQFVYLLITAVSFLAVLATLLWSRHVATNTYSVHSTEFLAPSMNHIAHAQHAVTALQAELHRLSASPEASRDTVGRFGVVGSLDNLEQHVAAIVRLVHAFDFEGAFDLPSRAHRQLDRAREALGETEELTERGRTRVLAALGPLLDTLSQLERIYELDQRRSTEAHEVVAERSLKQVLIAVAVLVLISAPLMFRLILGLRRTVRRETRARNDLEEAKRNLEVMAMYDSLTGLGNRHLFKARLDQAAGSSKRPSGFSALMYIDLDDFKRINDTLGHDAGDEVLKIVAERLVSHVRGGDTVARVGGDEFTVITTGMSTREQAGTVAAKLLQKISEPIRVSGTVLVVSASIGITIMPSDSNDPTVLMKNADMALYRAKDRGRNNFQYFVESMNQAMVAHMALESALRLAIERCELQLHYQPQIDLVSGTVSCLEALLRWRRDDGTLVPPDEFIPVAETSGLLTEIGSWVLTKACEDLAELRRDGATELRVSVNLSARQFRESNLVSRIQHALDNAHLPPSALEVEITETTLIEDIDSTSKTLQSLRALGIAIAIDDFGIGYSSLNYLKRLPIDALKIDRSFVRDVEFDPADRSIVDAVLAMARSLTLRIVAEGIESRWQLDYLTAKQCTVGQGFLLSPPLPMDELSIDDLDATWSAELCEQTAHRLHLVE